MTNIEYANAYSEVIKILSYIPKTDYDKIPKSKISLFEKNSNKLYNFEYNPRLTLDEQNVSKRAKAIIAILYRDYWATDEQREKITNKQRYDIIQIENKKQEQYNCDNLFKNVNKARNFETKTDNKLLVKTKEERLYKKILLYIKKFFRK